MLLLDAGQKIAHCYLMLLVVSGEAQVLLVAEGRSLTWKDERFMIAELGIWQQPSIV